MKIDTARKLTEDTVIIIIKKSNRFRLPSIPTRTTKYLHILNHVWHDVGCKS